MWAADSTGSRFIKLTAFLSRVFTRKRIVRGGLVAAAAIPVILVLFVLLVLAGVFGKIPRPAELSKIQNPHASEIYSSDSVLMGKYYIHNRQYLEPGDITVDLRNALIATEDVRFYHHTGIDVRSLGRVFVKTVFMGDRSSGGGSTLTQQLAKNLYPRKDYGILTLPVSKLKEMIMALRFERLYTKDEILLMYLSTVPFGGNALGIASASQIFFSKDPAELNREEAALLVGILKATDVYHPVKHPANAVARRNVVLSQMEKYHYLPRDVTDSLQALPLTISYNPLTHDAGIAPYFREILRQRVKVWCQENPGPDGETYNIYTDGLKIYTTIDSRLQKYAEKAVKSHMASLQEQFERTWKGRDLWKGIPNERILINYEGEYNDTMPDEPSRKMEVFTWEGMEEREYNTLDSIRHYLQFLQAGFLAMDVRTAEIRSWVGGIDYEYFKYDHVLASRQTGSVFKPLVYLAALEEGLSPCDYYPNDSIVYTEYDNWSPRNADRTYGGYYSMKGALAHSVNTVSVQLLMESGIESVSSLGQRAGIRTPLPAVPSLALGTGEVTLLEMTGAYQAIANRGLAREPVYMLRIEDKEGKVLYTDELTSGSGTRICSQENAEILTEMLRHVVNQGTAVNLRVKYHLQSDIAGKTGTTQNYSDGWFIGFTPSIVAGVWVGGDLQNLRFRTMEYGQGSSTALPVWASFMKQTMEDPERDQLGQGYFEISEATKSLLICDDFRERMPLKFTPLEDIRELPLFRRLFRNRDRKDREVPPEGDGPVAGEVPPEGDGPDGGSGFSKRPV